MSAKQTPQKPHDEPRPAQVAPEAAKADQEPRPGQAASEAETADQPAGNDTAATAPEAAGPQTAGEESVEDLRRRLEAAEARAGALEDRFLRAKAEADNVRRRAEIDVANAHKYAIERFAGELLSVKDSLELAKVADFERDNKEAVDKMLEGVDLTLKLMNSVFEKFALEEVEPKKGDKFDPERHQAMSMMESGEVAPNHVLSVVQKGYRLNERLLRPAMVVVAKAGSEQDQPDQS